MKYIVISASRSNIGTKYIIEEMSKTTAKMMAIEGKKAYQRTKSPCFLKISAIHIPYLNILTEKDLKVPLLWCRTCASGIYKNFGSLSYYSIIQVSVLAYQKSLIKTPDFLNCTFFVHSIAVGKRADIMFFCGIFGLSRAP